MSDHSTPSRRGFLALGGAAIIGSAFLSGAGALGQDGTSSGLADLIPGAVNGAGEYVLPEVGYPYNAVEAAIDAQTMEIHHTRHHKSYVDGLIAAEAALAKARESGDFVQVEALSKKATFHGGGHFLHCIFWDCMGPDGGGAPTGELAAAINRDFGSHEAMWKQFAAAAKAVEGSGWARLSLNLANHRLNILQGQNQNLLSNFAEIPLLVLDVWEHAYYLRYQNRRAEYVDNFPKVVDWKKIARRYERAVAG